MNIPSAFGNAEETRRASTLSNANYGGGPILSPAPQPRTVSHEDHDDEDPPYEQPVQPPIRNPHREDSKLLSSLSESLTTTVAASATVLKKLNAKKNRIPPAERAKRKLEEMIKINAKTPAVMPLWRHRLNGRHDPPPETVLRGRRLFRLIAKAVMYMFIKPTVAVIRRKLNARESHRKDLQKTLRLLAGAFDDWLGKIVQLPVTSIVQVGAHPRTRTWTLGGRECDYNHSYVCYTAGFDAAVRSCGEPGHQFPTPEDAHAPAEGASHASTLYRLC